ncbi:MAG: hypothetical protein EP341_00465, partial [Sphingomonadales bacterium]
MADTPADHPAVTVPKAALSGTSQILAAPGVLAQVKAPPPAKQPANYCEEVIRKLYPAGQMNSVSVVAYDKDTPNKMVKSVGYGAWTQSEKLIYYNGDVDDPDDFMAIYALKHEASHILQFQKKGRHPKTFQEMLAFEMESYPKAVKWLQSKAGEKFYIDAGWDLSVEDNRNAYDDMIEAGEANVAAINLVYVKSVAGLIGRYARRVAANIVELVSDDFAEAIAPEPYKTDNVFLHNMAEAEFVTKVKKDSDGKPLFYLTDDMYRLGSTAEDKER